MQHTLTYSEDNKGWTSFHSWYASLIGRVNNKSFLVKGGQLYQQHDRSNPQMNVFFDEQHNSKITTVFNDNPDDDKVFKTIVEEGNKSWKVNAKTNFTETSLDYSEFDAIESRHFAYLRGTENQEDLKGLSAQGLGNIQGVNGNNIFFSSISDSVNVGDDLYYINSSGNKVLVGTVDDHGQTNITVNNIQNTPIVAMFAFIQKNTRIEGSEIRGYFMEVELENNNNDQRVELFAVNTNAIKSHL